MMMIYENIRLALFSLKANKMRALLTMLGIIIGIGSVIAIMTVGDSVTSTVADSMSSLGANNITVTLEERKDDEEASDAMFGMNWGSSQDDNAKQPTQKDYITTDMLQPDEGSLWRFYHCLFHHGTGGKRFYPAECREWKSQCIRYGNKSWLFSGE